MGETTTTSRCLRCGRALRCTASITNGYGPTCGRKIRAAAKTSTHKANQVAKAVELIEDGAIIALRTKRNRNRVYQVIGSNGVDRYLTARQACNCAAGLKGRHGCYHRVAVELVSA